LGLQSAPTAAFLKFLKIKLLRNGPLSKLFFAQTKKKEDSYNMTCAPNVIQEFNSNPEIFAFEGTNTGATLLISYLKKLKLQKIFLAVVSDPRKGKVLYSIEKLLLTALSTVLFRMGSKRTFHQEGRETTKSETALAKFAGIHTGVLPNSKTIDDLLNRLNSDEMNEVLMSLFETLRKSKFFSSRPWLIPNGLFHVAIDAETIHKYTLESAHNCKQCPYCLKRERGGTVWYSHIQVVGSIVCPGGLRIPLYVYAIHAKSLRGESSVSDDKFKQECELSAFPVLLQKIRDRFPKLPFCVLADSLYANGPSMELLKKLSMEFMIVRKEGSMKTVGRDCDGLALIPDHKINHTRTETARENNRTVKRSWSFFNDIEYGDHKINILRFDEWVTDEEGQLISCVHWEWIVSWRLSKRNAPQTAMRGRLRWLEEDLFNTVKNRGFHMKHDYSRNSNCQVVWSILIMIALLVTELFTATSHVAPLKKGRSVKDFMRSVFFDLCKLGAKLFEAMILYRNIQIRYSLRKPFELHEV